MEMLIISLICTRCIDMISNKSNIMEKITSIAVLSE